MPTIRLQYFEALITVQNIYLKEKFNSYHLSLKHILIINNNMNAEDI